MKRRLLKLAPKLIVLLLFGAIINIAVAWGCVFGLQPIWSHFGYEGERVLPASEVVALLHWQFDDPRIQAAETYGTTLSRFGWTRMDGSWGPDDPNAKGSAFFLDTHEICAGWPFYSLRGWWNWHGDYGYYRGALVLPKRAATPQTEFLPIHPIALGFLVNTLFFAALVWLLVAAFKLRRFIRMKRHQCCACGYAVGTSPVCTECGKPVTARPDEANA